MADISWSFRFSVREEEEHALAELMYSDRRHTICEMAREVGLVHTTEFYILKKHSEFFRQ